MKYIMILFLSLSLALFLIGVLGFVLNRNNIIMMLICIEIMLLGITLSLIVTVTYKLCIFLAICIGIIYLIRTLARTVGFSGSQIITCYLR